MLLILRILCCWFSRWQLCWGRRGWERGTYYQIFMMLLSSPSLSPRPCALLSCSGSDRPARRCSTARLQFWAKLWCNWLPPSAIPWGVYWGKSCPVSHSFCLSLPSCDIFIHRWENFLPGRLPRTAPASPIFIARAWWSFPAVRAGSSWNLSSSLGS